MVGFHQPLSLSLNLWGWVLKQNSTRFLTRHQKRRPSCSELTTGWKYNQNGTEESKWLVEHGRKDRFKLKILTMPCPLKETPWPAMTGCSAPRYHGTSQGEGLNEVDPGQDLCCLCFSGRRDGFSKGRSSPFRLWSLSKESKSCPWNQHLWWVRQPAARLVWWF